MLGGLEYFTTRVYAIMTGQQRFEHKRRVHTVGSSHLVPLGVPRPVKLHNMR
jgi:hypothetical protein